MNDVTLAVLDDMDNERSQMRTLIEANEAKDRYIKQLELEIERLRERERRWEIAARSALEIYRDGKDLPT